MEKYKLHKVNALPATPQANAIYFVKEGTTEFKFYVTDASGVPYSQNTGTAGAAKRTVKPVIENANYTVVTADYTSNILIFNADTFGQEINVILNKDVCPDLDGELIIYSAANHVLNFVGGTGVTVKTTAGNLLKSANDGDSIAVLGSRPLDNVNNLAVYGSLVFTQNLAGEDGKTNYEIAVENGFVGTETEWLDSLRQYRPTKLIDNATQYTAILEDKDKFLIFANPINFIIPASIFSPEDELECRNKSNGDVTVVDGTGMTVQVVSSQTKNVPQYGFFGLRFETATVSGLLGQLKPI